VSQSLREKVLAHLDSLGTGPKRSMGQNFLISEMVIRKIVEAGDVGKYKHTLEVGPGLGALTEHLLLRAQSLQLIEFDHKFANYWRETRGCEVLQVDALKASWEDILTDDTVLISNLPYQISSRLLLDMSVANPAPQRMVLMFQKEVAQRIQDGPGDSDYSMMSVVVSIFWKTRLLLEAGAVDFYPKPNVASRVLVFDRKTSFTGPQQRAFLKFVKLCFEQKKKKLIKRLQGSYGKDPVAEAFERLCFDTNLRVAQLSPEQLFALFQDLSGLFP